MRFSTNGNMGNAFRAFLKNPPSLLLVWCVIIISCCEFPFLPMAVSSVSLSSEESASCFFRLSCSRFSCSCFYELENHTNCVIWKIKALKRNVSLDAYISGKLLIFFNQFVFFLPNFPNFSNRQNLPKNPGLMSYAYPTVQARTFSLRQKHQKICCQKKLL